MNNKVVTLTQQEIEDLRDDIKFKTTVVLQLKQLNGLPNKVTKLEVHSNIHWALFFVLLTGLFGLCWKVLAK